MGTGRLHRTLWLSERLRVSHEFRGRMCMQSMVFVSTCCGQHPRIIQIHARPKIGGAGWPNLLIPSSCFLGPSTRLPLTSSAATTAIQAFDGPQYRDAPHKSRWRLESRQTDYCVQVVVLDRGRGRSRACGEGLAGTPTGAPLIAQL